MKHNLNCLLEQNNANSILLLKLKIGYNVLWALPLDKKKSYFFLAFEHEPLEKVAVGC